MASNFEISNVLLPPSISVWVEYTRVNCKKMFCFNLHVKLLIGQPKADLRVARRLKICLVRSGKMTVAEMKEYCINHYLDALASPPSNVLQMVFIP